MGMTDYCTAIQGNFMELTFEPGSFDAAYAIEATCHADKVGLCAQLAHSSIGVDAMPCYRLLNCYTEGEQLKQLVALLNCVMAGCGASSVCVGHWFVVGAKMLSRIVDGYHRAKVRDFLVLQSRRLLSSASCCLCC